MTEGVVGRIVTVGVLGLAVGIAAAVACGPKVAEPAADDGSTDGPTFSCGDPPECETSEDCPTATPFCVFDDNDPEGCCRADACGEGGWEDLCHCRRVCVAECLQLSHTGHTCRDDPGCCDGLTCSGANEWHGGLCVQ